jgi:hypothetical protein
MIGQKHVDMWTCGHGAMTSRAQGDDMLYILTSIFAGQSLWPDGRWPILYGHSPHPHVDAVHMSTWRYGSGVTRC